jgi:hypothetical protein
MNRYYGFDMVPNGVSQRYAVISVPEIKTFDFWNNAYDNSVLYFQNHYIHAQVKLSSPYGLALLENLAVRQRGDTGGFGMRS